MTHTCTNCNAQFSSPHCPQCGQKGDVGKLTMHNVAHELWHGFTHTDKGIVKLWVDLFVRPGAAYRSYFTGRRKIYFSPVVFFLLSFGLYIYFDQRVFDYQDHVVFLRTGHLYNNEIGRYIQEHAKYIALIMLPFQAVLTWLFFRRRANFAECIVFWLFCVGFVNTLLVLFTPLRLLLINDKSNVDYYLSLLVMLVYAVHLIKAFGGGFVSILKSVLVVGLVMIINVYVNYVFLNVWGAKGYPTIVQSIEAAFLNKSVVVKGKSINVE